MAQPPDPVSIQTTVSTNYFAFSKDKTGFDLLAKQPDYILQEGYDDLQARKIDDFKKWSINLVKLLKSGKVPDILPFGNIAQQEKTDIAPTVATNYYSFTNDLIGYNLLLKQSDAVLQDGYDMLQAQNTDSFKKWSISLVNSLKGEDDEDTDLKEIISNRIVSDPLSLFEYLIKVIHIIGEITEQAGGLALDLFPYLMLWAITRKIYDPSLKF